MAGRKIFVGSLPSDITDGALRAEFAKYGQVEEVFIKQGCEPSRQWAFVTLATPEQAQCAKDACDRVLVFPGSAKPCDVMWAKNQGMFGQSGMSQESPNRTFALPDYGQVPQPMPAFVGGYGMVPMYGNIAPVPSAAHTSQQVHDAAQQPRKIFVGSLPDDITDTEVRSEFSKYGQIIDTYIKTGCETGRQWAFITFATQEQARHAKDSCDRVLSFPGSERACEVTIARHQGMFGQDAAALAMRSPAPEVPAANGHAHADAALQGDAPRKIFVGSLPDGITEPELRDEFSKYGEIADLFLKHGCEAGRQWAFITFATGDQAQYAKESTDRMLAFSDSDRACEVMIAKNQGKAGQAPLASVTPGAGYGSSAAVPVGGMGLHEPTQQPLPATSLSAHLTPWKMYRTAAGLPYYNNSATGVTQWECPPELAMPWRMYRTAAGLPYYHNSVTGVTQWECPPELAMPQLPQMPFAGAQAGAMYGGAGAVVSVPRPSPY